MGACRNRTGLCNCLPLEIEDVEGRSEILERLQEETLRALEPFDQMSEPEDYLLVTVRRLTDVVNEAVGFMRNADYGATAIYLERKRDEALGMTLAGRYPGSGR